MCGRTSCHLPKDVLARACAYRDRQGRQRLPEWKDPDKYCPSYNKSPQSSSPVLLSRLHLEKGADSSERIIAPMRWGLVPSWFKESDPSKLPFNITNCRSDTMMEKRSFKVPLGKGRRCVVLADGFTSGSDVRLLVKDSHSSTSPKPKQKSQVALVLWTVLSTGRKSGTTGGC